MIIRILGEGQYDVADTHMAELNFLNEQLVEAADAGDETGFALTLRQLLAAIRYRGTAIVDDRIADSDLVLPSADMPLAEVHARVRDDGLLPG
ncbi:PspA-associated protein PspAA [Nocardia sp. CA-135398]|uniref:PspA-associated protein PspAA n=1 Tax=Nocardia sp. CA-135398 TaxID=3239977 RepID=UPI003D988553